MWLHWTLGLVTGLLLSLMLDLTAVLVLRRRPMLVFPLMERLLGSDERARKW